MSSTDAATTVRLLIDTPAGSQTLLAQGGAGGAVISDILRRQGLPLNTRCGQRGLCDGCLVDLVEGELVHQSSGRRVAGDAGGVSLRGCEHALAGGQAQVRLRVGARSLLAHEPQVLSQFKVNVPFAHAPLLPPPQDVPPDAVHLGAAIDLGTTTVAVALVDLASGQIVGQAAGYNRQMHLGDDVLTRINLCSTDPAMLSQLQQAIVHQTIAPLLGQALRAAALAGKAAHADPSAPVPRVCLGGLVVAGNTTMLHLFAGVDPSPMGVAPFTPVFLEHRTLSSSSVGLDLSRHAAAAPCHDPVVHLLPGAAAYVGADLVAGLIASGLAYDPGPSLLVDVGTNGEILFKHGHRILGCAAAAGPAFEGARLTSGIRAGRGAIVDISLATDPFAVHTQVIGGDKPIGICGSAYIDFLAEGRRTGLLTVAGRFDPSAVPGADAHLLRTDGHAGALRIARTAGGQDILISETDIASLLQAKAAIAAGILTLLEISGLSPADIKTLYLAGGFGTHMDHRFAIRCGLLPGFEPDQVQVVGNSALAGSYLALVDRSVLAEMTRLAGRVELVELNLQPSFEEHFIDQLMLP